MNPIKTGNSIIFPDTGIEWRLSEDEHTVVGYTPTRDDAFLVLKDENATQFWLQLSTQVDAATEISSLTMLTATAINYIEHLQHENKDLASYIAQVQVQSNRKVM